MPRFLTMLPVALVLCALSLPAQAVEIEPLPTPSPTPTATMKPGDQPAFYLAGAYDMGVANRSVGLIGGFGLKGGYAATDQLEFGLLVGGLSAFSSYFSFDETIGVYTLAAEANLFITRERDLYLGAMTGFNGILRGGRNPRQDLKSSSFVGLSAGWEKRFDMDEHLVGGVQLSPLIPLQSGSVTVILAQVYLKYHFF